jgi:lipoate-protein ligase A
MSESWFLLQSNPGPAAENMALDEALLEAVARLDRPILRFYGWTEAAATFGYFQKYADIAGWTNLRPLVRRPTGGGLVPHDTDWTYSLVFPPHHRWHELKASESYLGIHAWIQAAFAAVGVITELSPNCHKEAPGRCFIGAESSDLLWQKRKIAGAAQRRNRHGLLIQGSVQASALSLPRNQWEKAMTQTAQVQSDIVWNVLELDDRFMQRVGELSQLKYSQPEYNQRR